MTIAYTKMGSDQELLKNIPKSKQLRIKDIFHIGKTKISSGEEIIFIVVNSKVLGDTRPSQKKHIDRFPPEWQNHMIILYQSTPGTYADMEKEAIYRYEEFLEDEKDRQEWLKRNED